MANPIVITPEMAVIILSLLENPAAYALVGWEEEMEENRPEEFKAWEDKLNAALAALGSKYTFQTLRRFHG